MPFVRMRWGVPLPKADTSRGTLVQRCLFVKSHEYIDTEEDKISGVMGLLHAYIDHYIYIYYIHWKSM